MTAAAAAEGEGREGREALGTTAPHDSGGRRWARKKAQETSTSLGPQVSLFSFFFLFTDNFFLYTLYYHYSTRQETTRGKGKGPRDVDDVSWAGKSFF
jgi:hypothetical protein